MSPDLFLTSLNDLKIEVPLPPEENVLPPEENVLPPEENVELKEVVPPKLTSSSSSSSSESSRENGEGNVAGIYCYVCLPVACICRNVAAC